MLVWVFDSGGFESGGFETGVLESGFLESKTPSASTGSVHDHPEDVARQCISNNASVPKHQGKAPTMNGWMVAAFNPNLPL